jgi:Zn-finger nucleic acid-binding protein
VPREALADILCAAELGGALRDHPPVSQLHSRDSAAKATLEAVRYLPCPLCHSSMNRVNFGKVSGVIVDVCKMHGTWFDAGELTRVVAFAGAGGLERTRERERMEKEKRDKSRKDEVHVLLAVGEARDAQSRLDMWQDFLRAMFSG